MANLIITILGITLLAVVAIAGVMYVSAAMDNAQSQATVSAWISQNTQILSAAQAFSVNNDGQTVVPMCGLVNGGYLSGWPNLITSGPSPWDGPTGTTTDGAEAGCWGSAPNNGMLARQIANYNGTFLTITVFQLVASATHCGGVSAGDFTLGSSADLQAVQLAVAFNNSSHANLPSGLTYEASGLPLSSGSWNVSNATEAYFSSTGCTGNPPMPNPASQSQYHIFLNANGGIVTGCFVYPGSNSYLYCYQTF